jgi:hypothetical protein
MREADPEAVKQFNLTPAAGKRLIAKGLAANPEVLRALKDATIVIVAGTTNGYVAEEIFAALGTPVDFSRERFFRGITLPSNFPKTESGRLPDEGKFPGDIVLEKGIWKKGQTIFDVVDELKEGDLVFKGANALDINRRRAAILIGHPKAGTIGAILQAVYGRRVRLILPVGLEKRVSGDLDELADLLNAPGAGGTRYVPAPGRAYTEIDALEELTGIRSVLSAAGGVSGAEGSVWLAVRGSAGQAAEAERLIQSVAGEPAFILQG